MRNASDLIRLMNELTIDLLEGDISVGSANAMINAQGKILKAAELQERYGKPAVSGGVQKELVLDRSQPGSDEVRKLEVLEEEIRATRRRLGIDAA